MLVTVCITMSFLLIGEIRKLMCFITKTIAYLCQNMIHFYAQQWILVSVPLKK